MNTIDELLHYCREIEPVGALMLTGEWGCGKTYLVDHELKDKLAEEAVVLRISLFGISSAEGMHNAIKHEWVKAYYKIKGINRIAKIFGKSKTIIKKFDFIPGWIKNITNIDATVFLSINKKINGKSIILVFDDLERCQMSTVDVLGVINDYCENQKYHTIIVANQDKIKTKLDTIVVDAEIQTEPSQKNRETLKKTKATLSISKSLNMAENEISYTEIKEKVILRTVKYSPNYSAIIHDVIAKMKFSDVEYKTFVESCEKRLFEIFASDRDDYEYIDNRKSNKETTLFRNLPHNIRSLKCAINDFHRLYTILQENNFDDIENWFYCFALYLISYKADIAKEGDYGTLFSDLEVQNLYPNFQTQYMLASVRKWILYGIWNKEIFLYEIGMFKKRKEATSPCEIIRVNRIMDIDEDVIEAGFTEFLVKAYDGNLSLDDYVLFILNNYWAREYKYTFPEEVKWEKINNGICKCIDTLKKDLPDEQVLFSIIENKDKKFFTEEELTAYELISNFALEDNLMFFKNRKLYIEKMKESSSSRQAIFAIIENKRYDVFDEEMAMVTANAFANSNNADKNLFVGRFKLMWKGNIQSNDFDTKESERGFVKLKELLEKQCESYNNKKTFSILHTNSFISIIDQLISSIAIKKSNEQITDTNL